MRCNQFMPQPSRILVDALRVSGVQTEAQAHAARARKAGGHAPESN